MSIFRNLRFCSIFVPYFRPKIGSPEPIFANFGLKTSFLHVSCQSKQFPRPNSISKIWSIIQLANWPIRWASEKNVPKGRVVPCDLGNHLHHRYWFQEAWISKNKKYFDKGSGIWTKWNNFGETFPAYFNASRRARIVLGVYFQNPRVCALASELVKA